MTGFNGPVLAAHVTIIILILAMGLALIRLIKGRSLCDRVVALDFMTLLMVGIVGAKTIISGESSSLFTCMVISLIAFLSTVAFAYYLERRGK